MRMEICLACSPLSLWHSDLLCPWSPQCSHFTVDFAPALVFGLSLVLFVTRSPAHPAVAGELDRDPSLRIALLSFLALRLRRCVDSALLVHWYRGSRGLPRTSCRKSRRGGH